MNKIITHGQHHFKVAADTALNLAIWHLGSAAKPLDCQIDLVGQNAVAKVYYCFIGSDQDKMTASITLNHLAPQTNASVVAKGMLDQAAQLRFDGKIYIAKGANRTESFLEHRTLLLSDKAQVTTIPALEILTDDVKASHAATVSHLDEEQLYYAQSRGLTETEITKLMVRSFFDAVLVGFPVFERSAIIKKLS
ncbi:MAG: SufD family Fe-S cluster assembly protein [bacterium]|nr:SufD family Fe-S cluster assembly protein [bacterium]